MPARNLGRDPGSLNVHTLTGYLAEQVVGSTFLAFRTNPAVYLKN